MIAILDAIVSGLQKMLGAAPSVVKDIEKLDPAIAKSAALVNVLAGAKVGAALPWAEIEKVIAAKLADPAADVQTLEDIAKDVAVVFPDAMYAADALAIVEALIQIGQAIPPGWQIVKVDHGKPYRGDGINPNTNAPLGV